MTEAIERLPRGRHGLTRAEVVESQRNRMMAAMASAAAEKGYAKTSVADVLAGAGVSRETFYEQFASKEECFLATFDRAAEILLGELGTVAEDAGSGGDRVERMVGAYLRALARQPEFARVYLVEAYALGAEAVRRRTAIQSRFAEALAAFLGARSEPERFACEALVAAVGTMVTNRLALGQEDTLVDLAEPVVDLIQRGLAAAGLDQ